MNVPQRVSRGLQDMLLFSHALSRAKSKINPPLGKQQETDVIQGKPTRHVNVPRRKTNGHNDRTIQLLRTYIRVYIIYLKLIDNFHLRAQHFHAVSMSGNNSSN